MCAPGAADASQLELSSTPALADQLLAQASRLPIQYIAATALMQIAAKRMQAFYADSIRTRAVEGWAGWTQVAPGWLLRISEDDDGVWIYVCKPSELAQRANLEHSAAFRAAPDSKTAQALRRFRKALRELA